mgnify:CR=1 FL=1
MKKGLIGRKLGMTQIFDEKGNVVPVTVVELGPCAVVQKKTAENDGYEAVQLGFDDKKVTRTNKPEAGHFKKADVAPKKVLREFRLDDISAINVGDIIKADVFAAGEKVDVVGTSKGKGNQEMELLKTQGIPRYRSCCKTCRFTRRLLRSFKSLQGKEACRSPRRRTCHNSESGRC